MFKTVKDTVWTFDVEWVPDPAAGRRLYNLSADLSDWEVMQEMWEEGGATEDDPRPFLKTVMSRIVSISAVIRKVTADKKVSIEIFSLPRDAADKAQVAEKVIVERFLSGIGKQQPQLVGFNSINADLKILIQRGVINGITEPEFCARPDKPWLGVDYFAKDNEGHIDLFQVLSSWGKGGPSLHEIAVLSGIPGKFKGDGDKVAELWCQGKTDDIVRYNEHDALTTYLVWLRIAHFAGHIKTAAYENEQEMLKNFLKEQSLKPDRAHLGEYLQEWQRLN